MREMDFTESNEANRWMGVKSIWRDMHFETKRYIKRYLEKVLRLEQTEGLGCGRYKRSSRRKGYRNGTYTRDLLTTYGWIEDLKVPRVREGGLKTVVLEKYRRRQRLVDRILLEAFLLGHSTRNTTRLFKRLFGSSMSAQTVSNIVKELGAEAERFHKRRFSDEYDCVYLDGLWITLSKPVKVKKVILVALGMRPDGTTDLLSFQVALSESESCWWGFLSDLKDRGLKGEMIEVIVSDAAAGLRKAIEAIYPRVRRQLCTFHKANDLGDHLSNRAHRSRIIADALFVFKGAHVIEVRKRIKWFIAKWQPKEPKAVKNFTRNLDSCLVYLDYPEPLRTHLKTNNQIERYIQEIRRRIIPMRTFNNTKSAERIVYGIIAYNLNQNPVHMPNAYEYLFTQSA
jgi:putative transposase